MKIYLSEQDKIPVQSGGVGLFFEDLNYALDGGLYAEMLENRNFEAKDVSGKKDAYVAVHDGGYAWEPYPLGAEVKRKIKTDRPLFAENPHYMMLSVPRGGWGIRNKAYDGIYLKKGEGYKISFYARSYDYKGKAAVGVYVNGVPAVEKKIRLRGKGIVSMKDSKVHGDQYVTIQIQVPTRLTPEERQKLKEYEALTEKKGRGGRAA